MSKDKEPKKREPRTREDVEIEVGAKGATPKFLLEVLLDIRDLLGKK